MKKSLSLIAICAALWAASTACNLTGSSTEKIEELSTQVMEMQEEMVPSLQAQLTEVAPTLEAQLDQLPTQAAEAGDSFTDFSAAPETVIAKVMQRIRDLKSYRQHVETFKAGELTGSMDFEIVNPDRMHGMIENDEMNAEVIMIGTDFYIKMGDSWMQFDTPMDLKEIGLAFEQFEKDLTDFKVVGPDNLDGRPTMVVQFSYTADELEYTSKVWMGHLDGYPYKVETSFEQDGEDYLTVMTLSDFDTDITIESPIE